MPEIKKVKNTQESEIQDELLNVEIINNFIIDLKDSFDYEIKLIDIETKETDCKEKIIKNQISQKLEFTPPSKYTLNNINCLKNNQFEEETNNKNKQLFLINSDFDCEFNKSCFKLENDNLNEYSQHSQRKIIKSRTVFSDTKSKKKLEFPNNQLFTKNNNVDVVLKKLWNRACQSSQQRKQNIFKKYKKSP